MSACPNHYIKSHAQCAPFLHSQHNALVVDRNGAYRVAWEKVALMQWADQGMRTLFLRSTFSFEPMSCYVCPFTAGCWPAVIRSQKDPKAGDAPAGPSSAPSAAVQEDVDVMLKLVSNLCDQVDAQVGQQAELDAAKNAAAEQKKEKNVRENARKFRDKMLQVTTCPHPPHTHTHKHVHGTSMRQVVCHSTPCVDVVVHRR